MADQANKTNVAHVEAKKQAAKDDAYGITAVGDDPLVQQACKASAAAKRWRAFPLRTVSLSDWRACAVRQETNTIQATSRTTAM
eukprot:3018488-Amphidinium_carterae.3